MIRNILFDMDGTLLPVDDTVFTGVYFSALAEAFAPLGYEPKQFIDTIWEGVRAMVKNDGSRPNDAVFWDTFCARFGEQSRANIPLFENFYRTDFIKTKRVCGYTPEAERTVRAVKEKARCVLATNPVFPLIAQERRVRWAGISPEEFEYITSYENSSFCKPNPAYFVEILQKLGMKAEETLMIGNDAGEDTAAEQAGIEVFLLTPCLINRVNRDLSLYPHGDYSDLRNFLREKDIL